MARINIEDSLWSDPRFLKLCIKLGDELRAVGAVVLAWKVAQRFYCPERLPIPSDTFSEAGLPLALVEVGLAEAVEGGVRMRGSDEHFAWWFQRQDAGRKGALAKAKRSRAVAKRSVSGAKQTVASSSSSSSFSSSFSSSDSSSNSSSEGLPILQSATPENPVTVYCDLWKARNGRSPDIRPKEAGQLNRLAKDLGAERAASVIRAFFAMPNTYYLKRGYSVGVLLHDLAAIQQFESTGKVVTAAVAEKIEKQVDKTQGTAKRRHLTDILADDQKFIAIDGGKPNDPA